MSKTSQVDNVVDADNYYVVAQIEEGDDPPRLLPLFVPRECRATRTEPVPQPFFRDLRCHVLESIKTGHLP